jgi:tetratricopeptide (TPR) repeat protein
VNILSRLMGQGRHADPLVRSQELIRQGNAQEAAGQLAAAADLYQRALQLAPAEPEAHLHLGLALTELGRMDEAASVYASGLARSPRDPLLAYNAANLAYAKGDYEAARELAQRAVDEKPAFAQALVLLSNVLDELGDVAGALATIRRALAVQPESAGAQLNQVRLLLQSLQVAEAIEAASHALRSHPDNAELHWSLAIAHLLQGDFEAGWREHEWRALAITNAALPDYGLPPWRGDDARGRTILLFAEQGFGDAIQFLRFVPRVAERAAHVVVLLPASLCNLARAALPQNCSVVGDGAPAPTPELQCALLALPWILGLHLERDFACPRYLSADPGRVAAWRQRLESGRSLRVGLVWSGNPAHQNDRNRSIPLELMRQIGVEACAFISLQPEVRATDMAALESWADLVPLGAELQDFADTAALIEALDLVVTVDTSVAHLAGALGRPVWILLPYCPDWRWMLGRADSPWYSTARLYRQQGPGQWPQTLRKVREDLVALVSDQRQTR